MLDADRFLLAGNPLPSLIAGEWVVSQSSGVREIKDPSSQATVGYISYGDATNAIDAANAAEDAFSSWANSPARYRCEILRRAAMILDERAEKIGFLLAKESGKRVAEAIGEAKFAAEYFRWFAEEARRPKGDVLTEEDPLRHHYTTTGPAGVVVLLSPWNFPISIQARKLAPALAAGCTVVARPSERAPLAVWELFSILKEAGVPDGVVNLIYGPADQQTSALLSHKSVRVVSFTGSTAIGSQVMATASKRIVKCALELGGDGPFLVFNDADVDQAVAGLMIAKFRNNGQSCIAANRVLVQDGVFGHFCEALTNTMSQFKLGSPTKNPDVDLGPLIGHKGVLEVESIVEDALAKGGSWLGESPEIPSVGHFTRPGFIVDAPLDSRLAKVEIFGPVVGIFPFTDEDEAVSIANDTEMGLAGYVYTTDSSRSIRIAERIEVGILGVNHTLPSVVFAPLGGVKQSGLGREGSRLGLDEFTETKYVSVGI